MYSWNDGAYLIHHGIKGQKWGVRRFQNEDGSLTSAGRNRYGYDGSIKQPGAKEYAKDRRRRIKKESEAIRNSKVSNKEKARALSKLGDHDSSAEYFQKDYVKKRNIKRIGNAVYEVGSKVASGLLAGMVKSGKMRFETGANIAKAAATGRAIANTYINSSMYEDQVKFRDEYWKFG